MKLNLKSTLLGFVIGAVAMGAIPVMSYDGVRTIQAVYKNIKVYVDGTELIPRDSSGQLAEPFIYNGTTYLPIRAVGEAVGKQVSYDSSTSAVYLGETGKISYLGKDVKAYQKDGAYEDSFDMAGNTYDNCVKFSTGIKFTSSQPDPYALYNLNREFTTISGVYGIEDMIGTTTESEAIINFYGDNKLIQSLEVKGDKMPENFTVDVSGIARLKIETVRVGGPAAYAVLGNVEIK